MKAILKKIVILLILASMGAYAAQNKLITEPQYLIIKEILSKHDICKKEYFGIIAYNTLLNYRLKGDCTAAVRIALSRSGFIPKEGKSLEQITLEALNVYFKQERIKQLNSAFKAYNKNFDAIDKDGYRQCGATGLFSVIGIEKLYRERKFITPYLNQDRALDCLGQALLDDCKPAKFTLMSYLDRDFDMHFKIRKEDGKCSLDYRIPLPSSKTIQAYRNGRFFPSANKKLPKGEVLDGKLDDIYEFINSKDNYSTIDGTYFEKEFGAKEKNKGAFVLFSIMIQSWQYYLMSM